MNNEALRKEIYEELHSQYESKLRDAKKQKSQLEEELESTSEKWRAERRRLNSEIDRLEAALTENRSERRKSGDPKAKAADPQEISKVQAIADEKLKKATQQWEGERTKLQSEISRLQRGIAELLERANNPMRAGQAVREQLESKLEEAVKTRQQAEDALIQSAAQWEKEKLKLAGEMIKLRRSLGHGKGAPPEEDRSREKELEKQLADATRKRQELEAGIEKARVEVMVARDAQSAEIEKLTAQLHSIRDGAAKGYAELTERERRETTMQRDALERDLQRARARTQELESSIDRTRAEILSARQAQSEELQRLTAQSESARNAGAREHSEQIERERREHAANREALERDLQKAQKDLQLLKESQAADTEREAAHLQESQKAQARIKELEGRLAATPDSTGKESAGQIEQVGGESALAREALERDLQKALKEVELLRGAQSADLERQSIQLEESQRAHTRIKELERRLTDSKTSGGKDSTARLEKEVAEAEKARQTLEKELQKALELKEKQNEELRTVSARLEESQREVQQLGRQLEESRDAVSTEVVEQLRRQYDTRMQEMIRQKSDISEQLNSASELLEGERKRFAAAAAQSKAKPSTETPSGPTIAPELLNAEFARVEAKIAEIARLIDDPSAELSLVIRKNVERAELDAYLKGILFSLGRSQGL